MSMAPIATVQAVSMYTKEITTKSRHAAAISADLTKHAKILSFSASKVQMMRIEDVPSGINEETRQFLAWLQKQPYTEVVTKDGRFQREDVYDYQSKIDSLEKEAQILKRSIGVLEQGNRRLTETVDTMQTLKNSADADEMAKAQQIICMENQILEHERGKRTTVAMGVDNTHLRDAMKRYDAHFDRQRELIRDGEATNAQLTTQNATLVREHKEISMENTTLMAENRSLSARLTDERRNQVKQMAGNAPTSPAMAFFTGIMPPFLTRIATAPAVPIAKLASFVWGGSKKRGHDDDDRNDIPKRRRTGF